MGVAGDQAMNVEAFQQLKRVLADVPARDFDLTNWHNCACGHATQDAWFVARGFSSCNDFGRAAAFFQISRREASRTVLRSRSAARDPRRDDTED